MSKIKPASLVVLFKLLHLLNYISASKKFSVCLYHSLADQDTFKLAYNI